MNLSTTITDCENSRNSRNPLFSHPNSLKLFGPAGSGKTRELVSILSEHVDDGDFRLPEGVIVSFTRAASRDIARRVNPDGEPGRYHCTLHALCKRYYGFDGALAETRLKEFFAQEHIAYRPGRVGDGEEWAPTEDSRQSEGGQLLAFFSLCRNRLLSIPEGKSLFRPGPDLHQWWLDDRLEKLWLSYVMWKRENDLSDFTDMLEYAVENPPQAAWFPFFVLDEAQDCTPLQWAVANAFAACADVVYIAGDDDQAIYSWAGATPAEFLRAETGENDILHVNYRSGRRIVDEAQRLIRRNRERQEKDIVADRDGGSVTRSAFVPALSLDEPTFVMARAHYLNNVVMDELTRQGYPFVDKRGREGVTGGTATVFGRFSRLASGKAVTLEEWRLLCGAIPSAGPWLTRGAKTRLSKVDTEMQRSLYVRVRDLVDHGATDDLINAILAGDTKPLGRVDQERMGYLREVERRYGSEYLSEQKAASVCQVGPIHAFKGLECDHAVIHTGMPPAAAAEAMFDREPERRVAYVAITRAKERVSYIDGPAMHRWTEAL